MSFYCSVMQDDAFSLGLGLTLLPLFFTQSYQYHLENRSTQDEFHPRTAKRPRIEMPGDITTMELDRIMSQVAMFTNKGEPVQWKSVTRYG